MAVMKKKTRQPGRRFARLEARISPDQKLLFQKAAALEGRSLTDFVIGCIVEKAKRVIQEYEVITLSERDRELFVKALLKPGAPNTALRKAAKWYKEIQQS